MNKLSYYHTFIGLLFILCMPHGILNAQVSDSSSYREINGKKYNVHVVQKGNTLYSLSRQYNVSVDAIVEANPSTKSGLSIGQSLFIPVPDRKEEQKRKMELDGNYIVHEVTNKQTIYAISKMYNVEIKDIAAENQVVAYGIKPGDLLRIPINKIKRIREQPFDATEDDYPDYQVKPQETLFSISKKYGVSIDDIKRVNNGLPEGLKEGQVINIPFADRPGDTINIDTHQVVLKQRYNIALFLPLFIDMNDSLESERPLDEEESLFGDKNTAAALKFYQGVKMALDSMGKLGFKATLYVYDTENDTNKVKSYLKKTEFKDIDLIIGPLYPDLFKIVAEHARLNKVNIVSPINPSNRPLLGNPHLIKIVTSKTSQVNDLSKFLANNYRKQHVMVLRKDISTASLEKTFLDNYKECLEIIADSSIASPAAEFTCNSATKAEQIKSVLRTDVQNILFVPSTDRVFVTDVVRKLNTLPKEYQISLFGMDEWLKFDNIDMDYFNRLNLHIISWSHIDYENEETMKFVNEYYNRFQSFPGEYANRAFDVAFYMFSMMSTYGNNFVNYMEQNPRKLSAHSFRFCQTAVESGFENQSLVILKFEDYKLVKVN